MTDGVAYPLLIFSLVSLPILPVGKRRNPRNFRISNRSNLYPGQPGMYEHDRYAMATTASRLPDRMAMADAGPPRALITLAKGVMHPTPTYPALQLYLHEDWVSPARLYLLFVGLLVHASQVVLLELYRPIGHSGQ